MTVMVPVDKAESLGIRAIVPKRDAKKALKLIAEENIPINADWKMRYQINFDLLKQGGVLSTAKVVRSLFHRSKTKELPIQERKLFDSALKLLIDEISYSLKNSKEAVEKLIYENLAIGLEK
jgi:CarD family transcriptional regulator